VPRPRTLLLGLVAVGNVTPLYGVFYWQWDTFQLLMLYWRETVILAFWILMRRALLFVRCLIDEASAERTASAHLKHTAARCDERTAATRAGAGGQLCGVGGGDAGRARRSDMN
jgi:hypothetical protein